LNDAACAYAHYGEFMPLSAKEHQLIFEMLKQQQILIVALTETLKASGMVNAGDLAAYAHLSRTSGQENAIERQLAESYKRFAKALGYDVNLVLSTDAGGSLP
jgi:hypothetical protein